MTRKRNINLLTACLCLSTNIYAAEVDYSAGVSLAQYDNVNLIPNPTQKETSVTLRGALSVVEDTATYSTNIDARARLINYTNDIAPDQNTGDMVANLLWKIDPGRFEWYLDDVFTQSAIDTLASNSPANRQNVNILSTGPDYTIRFDATNNLIFQFRVERYNYEINRDNNRASAAIIWSKQLNSRLNVSLNDYAEKVKFDDSVFNNNFQRNDIFLAVSYISGMNTLDAQYGTTKVINDIYNDSDYDRYLLAINRASTRTSNIRLSFENIATDTGSQILQTGPGISAGSATSGSGITSSSNDIYVDKTYRAQYNTAYSSGSYAIDLFTRDRNYMRQNNLDAKTTGAALTGIWNLATRDSVRYGLTYLNTLYLDPAYNREDDDYYYVISYDHRLRRTLRMGFSVRYSERNSIDSNFDYEDITYIFNLDYTSE